jgi:hypothetical protein
MSSDLAAPAGARDGAVRGPTLRQAVVATIVGYLLSFGTPFATFNAIPKIYVAADAAQTTQNLLANQGLLGAAIFAMLLNFVGDIVGAWGMYILLRPVNAAWSLLAAWFRLVYTAVGLAAVLNLVTAHALAVDPDNLAALGRSALEAQVHVALSAFQAQFAFSLIVFGLYLAMVGGLSWRSTYIPKWLGAVLAVDGLGWVLSESGPYLLPKANLGFLMIASLGELVFLAWLVGWGLRLKEPALEHHHSIVSSEPPNRAGNPL